MENQTAVAEMKDGTATKALFIKHLSLTDWEIIEELRNSMSGSGFVSTADVIRFAIRKAGNRL